jgi:hypothetical protein
MREADDGALVLLWSTSDRLYVLTGPITDEVALSIANRLE